MTIDQGTVRAELGVIGGSGLYALLDDVAEVRVDTPYGPPSDALFVGEVAGRRVALEAARGAAWEPVDGGTLVVIEGPRFSTRAESRWCTANGWSVVGMTGHPEAVLARELGLCYSFLELVTDLDAGVESGEGVTHAEVLEAFAANVDRLRTVLFKALELLPGERDCVCSHALDGVVTGLPGVVAG
jgi:5'-methylthioadenosine phosphorylase